MNVDNSGASFVFDAKTTQAIEEGKNRITLLQVEELRLSKLKQTLEGQIIKLEADIDYKEKKVSKLDEEVSTLEVSIEEAVKQLNAANKFHGETKAKVDSMNADLGKRQDDLVLKESKLLDREHTLSESEYRHTKAVSELEADRQSIDEKKQLITELVSKL